MFGTEQTCEPLVATLFKTECGALSNSANACPALYVGLFGVSEHVRTEQRLTRFSGQHHLGQVASG